MILKAIFSSFHLEIFERYVRANEFNEMQIRVHKFSMNNRRLLESSFDYLHALRKLIVR